MATVYQSFTQPAAGSNVAVITVGDPKFALDDIVTLFGYGDYQVTRIYHDPVDAPAGGFKYDLQLLRRTGGLNVVPAGTLIITYTEGVTVSEKSPGSGVAVLSFREGDYQLLNLNADVTLNAQHHAPGRSVAVRIRNGTSQDRTLSFSGSWKFLGAKPSSIAPNKTGVLSITCLGQSDLDIIAVWAVEA